MKMVSMIEEKGVIEWGKKPVCWVVTDGKAGTENQCIGLAEAMGLEPIIKRISLRNPWKVLTPHFKMGLKYAMAADSDSIEPPWPDLVIASGRQSTAPAIYIKGKAKGKTMVVQLQDPRCDPMLFDMVVVPFHDRLRGPNVRVTHGALNRITPEKLAIETDNMGDRFGDLPKKKVAVLFGGKNKIYDLDPMSMGDVMDRLANICTSNDVGLMVTASRRTGENNMAILAAKLKELPAYIWDGKGKNPYFAFLGLADAIIVTADSASMISEAASTGKPVYIIDLEGGSPKFDRFHEHIMELGAAKRFTGELEDWSYTPLNDTAEVAAEVATILKSKFRI